jgi:hypothetical protein
MAEIALDGVLFEVLRKTLDHLGSVGRDQF